MKNSVKEKLVPYLYEPVEDYVEDIRSAKSPEELKVKLVKWQWIAEDACIAADKIDKTNWKEWKQFLKDSKREDIIIKEDLMDKYGPILLPEKMLNVSLVATKFNAPWGAAYNRMLEEGVL